MDFAIDLGVWGLVVLIVGAAVIGAAFQLVGDSRFGYEWMTTGIGALVGGFVASEWIVGLRTFEPVFDGLALVPALVAGLLVGAVADVVVRYGTGGSWLHGPHAA